MTANPESMYRGQGWLVLLSALPLLWTALLMKWLVGASRFAALVWDRGESPGNWLNFGGNSSEVYSHWLNWAAMSGSAVTLSWMLVLDWMASHRSGTSPWHRLLIWTFPLLAIVFSWTVAGILDSHHGEGATQQAVVFFFVPLLASSFLVVRGAVSRVRNFTTVLLMAISFGLLHLVGQWFYEPSGTGGPSSWFFPVGAAVMLILALARFYLDRLNDRGAPRGDSRHTTLLFPEHP